MDHIQNVFSSPVVCKSPENTKNPMTFELTVTSDSLVLIEKKEGKSRTFSLFFSRKFLEFNQRRASLEEIAMLGSRLRVWGLWMLQEACISADLTQTVSQAMLQLAKQLQSSSAAQESEKTTGDAEKIAQLKAMLSGLRESAHEVVVTNQALVNPALNTVYSLLVEKDKILFVEKSKLSKNKVTFDLAKSTITLNDQPMTTTAIDWFIEKISRVGQDLSQNRAELYKD